MSLWPLKGTVSAEKALHGLETEKRELQGGTKEESFSGEETEINRGQTCLLLFKVVALVQVAHRGRLGRGLFTAAAPTKLEEWHFVIYTLQSRLDDVFFVPLKTLYSLQYLCLESSPPLCT